MSAPPPLHDVPTDEFGLTWVNVKGTTTQVLDLAPETGRGVRLTYTVRFSRLMAIDGWGGYPGDFLLV